MKSPTIHYKLLLRWECVACVSSECAIQRLGGETPRPTRHACSLVLGIGDTLGRDTELGVGLGKGGRIKNGANAILSTSLAQTEAGRTGVRHNVAPNGLGRVLGKTHAVTVIHRNDNE